MKRKQVSLAIGVVVLCLVGLLYDSTRSSAFRYVSVSEIAAARSSFYDHNIRVRGKVAKGSVDWNPKLVRLSFVITERKYSLPVLYHGVAPDTFREGGEVVATGTFTRSNRLEADQLQAKCPSKYETQAAAKAAEKQP